MTEIYRNKLKLQLFLKLIPLFGVVSFVLFFGPNLFSKLLNNFGSLGFLPITCVPEINECDPNQSTYSVDPQDISKMLSSRDHFKRALILSPGDEKIKVHLAEISFLTGDRKTAVATKSEFTGNVLDRSWLSFSMRYPAFLLSAWEEYLSSQWIEAIDYFRLGLFSAGENVNEDDELAYADSLSNYYSFQKEPEIINQILAGIYAFKAAKPGKALDILSPLAGKPGSNSNENSAFIYRYLGLVAADLNNLEEAEASFLNALEMDPDNRLTHFDLLKIFQLRGDLDGVETVKTILKSMGPSYLLGVTGGSIEELRPAMLPDGWELVGYDVESQLIPDSHELEILLWWKNSKNPVLDAGMVDIGKYILQKQTVINLLPNPGMEWGLDNRGLPVGYDREFYTGEPGNLTIHPFLRDDILSSALLAQNTPAIRSLALASRAIPVDPDAYMLMAGWIYRNQGAPNIGRNCWGVNFSPGGPQFIAYTQGALPEIPSWIHAANLSTPVPGSKPDTCEVLLINYESPKPAAWDQLLWVNVNIP